MVETKEKALSLLKATLDSTADGILVVDISGRITSFNRRFVQLWRLPEDVIASRDDNKALSFVLDQLKDPDGFLKKVRELYDQPAEESFDVLEFKDGRVFERYSRPQALGERVVGRVWSFRDVTERCRIEESEKRKTEELARSNKELKQFASIVAHDIQEPLRTIEAFAERLAKMTEGRLDEKEADYLTRIRRAASRMGQFTSDLLLYSKIATKEQTSETVNLNDVLREVLQDLEHAIQESGVRVEVTPLPSLRADRMQMRQLFQNLLSNAVKFTQKVANPKVTVRSRAKDQDTFEITVSDNGIGFEPEYADRIFEPFERLHDREDYPGSGMGLAVCRRIIERHNGTITAEGEVGEGATFQVVLPA